MRRGPADGSLPRVMQRVILVLDLGSSRLRCALVPLDGDGPPVEGGGAPLEAARAPYPVTNERAGTLAHAYNPRLLRTRLLRVLAQGAQAAGPANVAAVAVTSQRNAACFLDAQLATLSVSTNTDTRAVFQGGAMDESHGALIYRTTGHLPSMLFTPAKYAWWQESRPRTARRIAKTGGLDAWAALQLTGTLAETRLGLAESGLLDVTSGKPTEALLERLGVPFNLLPDVLPPDTALGPLTAEAAEATGLPRTTPVHLAGPDSHAACGRLRRSVGRRSRLHRRVERAGAGDDRFARVRPAGADVGVAARRERQVDGGGAPRRHRKDAGRRAASARVRAHRTSGSTRWRAPRSRADAP